MSASILTTHGKEKLVEELHNLKNVKLVELAERIRSAKEHGDLRENAEYHEAREEQGFVNGRIQEIENILKTSDVVEKNQDLKKVQIESKIVVLVDGQKINYQIVGSNEADPSKGLISCESPLGLALLDKSLNETIQVELPRGLVDYKIIEIK